ncbi:MAG TPA: hypothetical protein VNX28_03440 [Gemmataceae bacterium]|jgi:hypothetical protein|nr:hypothetical protein [Gemmataceae bacterium]
MKTELRLAPHSVLPVQNIIELWHNGQFIGQVTGADGPGCWIVSKHPVTVVDAGDMVTEVRIAADVSRN